jgi:hypothetical protein
MAYALTASPLRIVDSGLPAVLMIALSRRFQSVAAAPKNLMRSAWDDAGYCIDAPERMPAGGCAYEEVDDDLGLPVQLVAERDGIYP